MSMSLRLRAVCRRPAMSSPHAFANEPFDVEEQVFARAVVGGAADRVEGDAVERVSQRARVGRVR